jgi:hypothetical protein
MCLEGRCNPPNGAVEKPSNLFSKIVALFIVATKKGEDINWA